VSVAAQQGAADQTKRALDKRFEWIGWGLFLIMLGGLALVPNHLVPQGTWLVGTGLIMLGLNGGPLSEWHQDERLHDSARAAGVR
jgi:hypothetical protein